MQESIQLVLDSAPFLLKGAWLTLQLSLGGMFLGLALGFMLAMMRLSSFYLFTVFPLLCFYFSWYAVDRSAIYDLLRITAIWY